jgi:hypothetical protein
MADLRASLPGFQQGRDESEKVQLLMLLHAAPPSHCPGLRGHRVGVSYTAERGMCAPALRLFLLYVNTFFQSIFNYIFIN